MATRGRTHGTHLASTPIQDTVIPALKRSKPNDKKIRLKSIPTAPHSNAYFISLYIHHSALLAVRRQAFHPPSGWPCSARAAPPPEPWWTAPTPEGATGAERRRIQNSTRAHHCIHCTTHCTAHCTLRAPDRTRCGRPNPSPADQALTSGPARRRAAAPLLPRAPPSPPPPPASTGARRRAATTLQKSRSRRGGVGVEQGFGGPPEEEVNSSVSMKA